MESQEVYETPPDPDKKRTGVSAMVSQFDCRPIMTGGKKEIGCPSKDGNAKPKTLKKPAGVAVMPIVTTKVSKLKPVIPAKKPENSSTKAPLKPPTKPVENKIAKPNGIIQNHEREKETDAAEKENVADNSVSAIKAKFNNEQNGISPVKKKPVPIPKTAKRTKIEMNFVDDTVHYSSVGKKYKLLKLPESSGDPPIKPKLPTEIDLYDIRVENAEEEGDYEDYDDVVPSDVKPNAAHLRPVSMIPELTEEEEEGKASNFRQESYDDTALPATTKRTVSLIDEEVYEEFSDHET